jgi:hypothetical protein
MVDGGAMGGGKAKRSRWAMRGNGRGRKMDGSGNHDGQWQQDCNGWRQQQWAMAARWAAEQQSNCNERWAIGRQQR